MKFFLDTGDIDEIKAALPWGIVDGVTTNPSIIAKTGRQREEVIQEICELVDGPVSAEVIATERMAMITEGEKLAALHKNIVVKLPITEDGIGALKVLTKQKIKTNLTLCFSPNQALLAAKNGATYVSPFIGRLDDCGQLGMGLIEEIRRIYDIYGFETEILAASIRSTAHVREAALTGAHVGTMPTKVMKALFYHPLTDKGLAAFLEDHAKANQ